MAGTNYPLEPKEVPTVKTTWRTIATKIPAPESVPILKELRPYEPRSMQGQPPIMWDRADGCQVHDRWGNTWLDWSSGVLVTNAGHNHPAIKAAMIAQIEHGLVHNYCFPSEVRGLLAKKLVEVAPDGIDRAFLLSTGGEGVECAIKLARTYGHKLKGPQKDVIVSFHGDFHGRTLGAQLAGGIPSLKEWIVNRDPSFVQVDFPDGFRCTDVSFEHFERQLAEQGVDPDNVAGVLPETYQGGDANFAPAEYMQRLREWTTAHGACLIMDEVQAGFGRTGTYWGFEHYGIVPDMICCGKGISSGLPVSATLGRADIMDLFPPGSMTSTHTGNPICMAAALANLEVIGKEGLVEKAARSGALLHESLAPLVEKYDQVGCLHGLGMVAALHIVAPGRTDPDGESAARIVQACYERGLLMFSPVGTGGGAVKISPPLTTPEDAIREGVDVLTEAMAEVLG